jgi:hypothetical protein
MKPMNHQAGVLQRSVALAGSVALHLAVLLAVSWSAAVHPNGGNGDTGVEVNLINEAGQIKAKADTSDEGRPDMPVDGELANTALSKCDGRIYTGIGVRAWSNGVILEVASGGPAGKAGLRAGDILLDFDITEPDQHKPGTPVTLRYLREEREMPPVVALVEEICNEQPRPPVREPGTV